MAAQYRVELVKRDGSSTMRTVAYVLVREDKSAYRQARKRAERRMATSGQPGYRAVSAHCVG